MIELGIEHVVYGAHFLILNKLVVIVRDCLGDVGLNVLDDAQALLVKVNTLFHLLILCFLSCHHYRLRHLLFAEYFVHNGVPDYLLFRLLRRGLHLLRCGVFIDLEVEWNFRDIQPLNGKFLLLLTFSTWLLDAFFLIQ